MRADDRLATIVGMTPRDRAREIWNFDGMPRDLDEMLGRSWDPRSNDEALSEFADRADLRPASVVVDVGCYDASRSESLVHKTGCRLVGVDISRHGADARRARASTSRPDRRLSFIQGRLEAIPVRDEIADLTWCRDAISCASAVAAVPELARITRSSGFVVLQTTCATSLLEAGERAWLFDVLGLAEDSMDGPVLEASFAQSGLRTVDHVRIGSQSFQARAERGLVDDHALRISRLREYQDRYVRDWGEAWYQRVLAWETWPIYQVLGKLEDQVWLLRRQT